MQIFLAYSLFDNCFVLLLVKNPLKDESGGSLFYVSHPLFLSQSTNERWNIQHRMVLVVGALAAALDIVLVKDTRVGGTDAGAPLLVPCMLPWLPRQRRHDQTSIMSLGELLEGHLESVATPS